MLYQTNGQSRLRLERKAHIVSKEAFKLCGAQIGAGGDLDDGEIGVGWHEAFGAESMEAIKVRAESGDLGTAAGEGFGIALRPDFVQGFQVALEKIDLAKEGDRRLSVGGTVVEEVGAEFEHRVSLGAECRAQWMQIDELEDVASDGG